MKQLSIQEKMDRIYAEIRADMARRYAPGVEKKRLRDRRRKLIAAINNNPENYMVGSAFEGFAMCFPKVRMRFLLTHIETVIRRRVHRRRAA